MQFSLRFMRHSRWAFISGTCIGLLLAFPLTAPVWDGKILEPVSTLWGNALGAIGAVAAAVWAADRGSSQQERQAAALIYTMFKPIATHCDELNSAYAALADRDIADPTTDEGAVTPEEWERIRSLANSVANDYQTLQDNRQRVDSVFFYLSPNEMQVFLDLEKDVKSVFQKITFDMYRETSNANQKIYGGLPYGSSRAELQKLNSHMQQNVRKFEAVAR